MVALYTEGFVRDAESAASSKGMPAVRRVALAIPPECSVPEQIEAGLSPAVMDRIVAALMQPLTTEEQARAEKRETAPPRVAFKGTLDAVNRFFYGVGWADGLPIIPPTEEAVAEMLTGTDLPPHHVVTRLIPMMGKATVEKIAVNAVMAGALPTHMPVLLAAVEALMDPRGYFGTYEVSTGSWAPCLLVNGRIRTDLQLNSGSGVMSPGDLPNSAIGRALGLIVRNIGGARKGVEDMGTVGNPMKYALVIAENEDESPWEPLHVQQGLEKQDSSVTVFYPNSLVQAGAYGSDPDGIVRAIAYSVPPVRNGMMCVLIIPAHARLLANGGWTKKDVATFVAENARVPLSHHPQYWGSNIGPEGKRFLRNPKDSPHESVAIFDSPEWMRIVVAGGEGAFIGMLMGPHAVGVTGWVTRKIELPANWDELARKHNLGVPTYLKY